MRRAASAVASVAAALALALAAAAPARAQGEAEGRRVTVTVRGLAGPVLKARPRRFLAVNVVLENGTARDQDGTLRVYRVEAPGRAEAQQRLFYERRVALPRGARRVETVYYYVQEEEPQRQLGVAFAPDDGEAPAPSYPDVQVVDDRLAVLALSSHETDEATRMFRAAAVLGPRRTWTVDVLRAEPTALPDHIVGYDAVDTVVVTDLDGTELAPERARVLADWVAAGGDLVVAASGRGVAVPEPLRALLPVARPGGAPRAVELPLRGLRSLGLGVDYTALAEGRVLVDDVRAAPGADVLAAEGEQALVVRGRHGAGWVTYCAFPLDAAPLRRWPELPILGGALLRPPREPLGGRRDAAEAPPLEELQLNLSEALASLEPPSVLVVAPLLLLYVVLVGPALYVALARRARLTLAPAAAAGVAVAFGGLFFAIGRASKGSEDLVTQVAVVDLPVGTPGAEPLAAAPARVDVLTGYYSTRQGLAAARGPDGAQVGAVAEQVTSREGRVIEEAGAARLEDVTVATWALRRFRSTRAAPLGRVDVGLALEGATVRGRLVNRTAATLETPLLLLPHGVLELGAPLAPGQTLEVPGVALRRFDDLEASPSGVERLSWIEALLRRDTPGGYAARYGLGLGVGVGGGDPYGGSDARRVLAILRHRLDRVPGSAGRVPVLLCARVAGDPGGVVVEGTGAPTVARSLVFVEAQAALAPGRLALVGLPARTLGAVSRGEGHWIPVGGSTGAPGIIGGSPLSEAQVEFAWRVPMTERTRLDTLRVRWRTGPDSFTPLTTYLWAFDSRRRAWVQLCDMALAGRDDEGVKGWSPGPDAPDLRPEDLVDPASGTVRVQVRNSGVELSVVKLALDVAGVRE